ncbi:MAG: M60 family metallopeptidase [Puniceicoccales bacterium]|jgi:hypothetical protein|nr:M60 family metallopeptidase [Puniceicoccales bacterium]
MKTKNLSCLFLLFFLSAFIIPLHVQADIAEDYAAVTTGLSGTSLNTMGSPGSVALLGKTAFPFVLGAGSYRYAVGAGGRYNDSYDSSAARAVVFAHTGWRSTSGNYGVLLENCVKWTSKKSTGITIATDDSLTALRAYFTSAKGYTVKSVTSSLTDANLNNVDVLIISLHTNFSEDALTAIKKYTASGKGLIGVATPWAFDGYAPHGWANSREILGPFGLIYSGSGPRDASFTISSSAYSPYYSALNSTQDLIKDKEKVITMAGADKLTAANAIAQVVATDPGNALLSSELEKLSDNAHYGWINITPTTPLNTTSQPVEAMLTRYQSYKFDNLAPGDLFVHPSASGYPGLPTAGSPATKTISINGNTPSDFYMNQGYKPVRVETGLYAAPGTAITVTIPQDKIAAGLMVHIGGSEDVAFNLGTWRGFPKIWRRVNLTSTTTQTGHVFGGLVTLLVPAGSNLGTFDVTVSGALKAPAFVLGQMTDAEWNNTEKHNPGAAGYIQTDKMTIYLPRAHLVAMNNPTEVATYWKKVMDTSDDIYGYTQWRKRGEILSANIQVAYGAAYAGYPIEMGWGYTSETELNSARLDGHWGDYHELGHGYQDNFDGEFVIPTHAEVDVNLNCGLLYTLVHDRTSWDGPTHSTYDGAGRLSDRTAFLAQSSSSQTWSNACGRATGYDFYFNIAEAFGWQAYKKFFTRLMNYLQNPTNATDAELYALRNNGDNLRRDRFYLLMCDATGRNLDAYFQRYGLGATGKGFEITQSVKNTVAAKNYPVWNGPEDNPPINSLSNPGSLAVNEDAPVGTEIYQFVATRPATPGVIWDYSITAGNGDGAFSIDKRTGILRVLDIDHARKSSYALTVTVRDNCVPRQAKTSSFTVSIQDVVEPPKLSSRVFSASTAQAPGSVVGDISAVIEDGRTIASCVIIGGNANNAFSINSSGTLTLEHPDKVSANTVVGLMVRMTDNEGRVGVARFYVVINASTGVKEERWNGTTMSGDPSVVGQFANFASPERVADNYFRRVSGFLIPPRTGYYTFWIASDDESTLYLSSDSDADKKSPIASVSNYTSHQSFDEYVSQKSTTFLLQGGNPYYIEAQQREGNGNDHVSVAWAGPGLARQIIPGSALIPNLTGISILSAEPSSPVSYAEWQSQFQWSSPEDSLPGADPDGDGLDNLTEYAFGGNPLHNDGLDVRLLPTMGRDNNGNPVFVFTRDTMLTDITYEAENSVDLQNWATIPLSRIIGVDINGTIETCQVATNSSEKGCFYRIKIVQSGIL